ncbi:cytochrome P450 [Nocardioides aurantiacus]|uniref:Cytochrome P450 n=1 Tax=Nocardioides aurantiacus TaxID=86796 RepID=A0A3N2CUF9_9ACTN|nr:cytochrome P450 [Nocardioides aurantiacus]ROR91141.1 cytochrome P450 [Nocardioides aurantiacus]
MATTTGPSTSTSHEDVPFWPMPRDARCPLDPAPQLAELQTQAPLVRVRLWDGSTPWLVTRHAEHCALLNDRRVSADWARDGYPFFDRFSRDHHQEARFLTVMDDPEHLRVRRMVASSMRYRTIEASRPKVQRIVDGLIDTILDGPQPCDLVTSLALPVPLMVICEKLGIPYEDHSFFRHAVTTITDRTTAPEVASDLEAQLYHYLVGLIERKLADPRDDLLSELVTEQLVPGHLDRHDLVMLVLFLLVSGHETTASMIALGTLALLTHPDQIDVLKGLDADGVAGAVDELLRYLTTVQPGRRRVAIDDIEIGGQIIKAGEGIVLPEEIGNRDDRVFDNAHTLDLTQDSHKQLAFGFGGHQCVGQTLARMELQVVFGNLFRRIPTLRLAVDLEQVPFMNDGIGHGVNALPVTW